MMAKTSMVSRPSLTIRLDTQDPTSIERAASPDHRSPFTDFPGLVIEPTSLSLGQPSPSPPADLRRLRYGILWGKRGTKSNRPSTARLWSTMTYDSKGGFRWKLINMPQGPISQEMAGSNASSAHAESARSGGFPI